MRIAPLDLLTQNADLRVLAAETQNRGAGHIGMVQISSDECTKIVGVFTGSSAAALMHQELDAIDVLEYAPFGLVGRTVAIMSCVDFCELPIPVEAHQFGDLLTVHFGRSKPQFYLEGLL